MTPRVPSSGQLSPVKRALLEIRQLRARLADADAAARAPIAILGAGLRLPGGANDLDSLAALLFDGRDVIETIPPARWDLAALFDADADAPGKMTTRHGGFIEGVDRFDAEFFGIAPREAESMDPQQRLMLETAWHALEDACIAPGSLHGSRTGVFFGVCNSDYARMLFGHRERIDPWFSPGTAASVLAGRLSYFLGLHGPSLAVDTACSSSLVALHLAVQSLRSGECDHAIVGGVNLILSPEININFSKARMMAADGRCKTFDAAADGYVRSEGCAAIVLKRLADCTPSDRVLSVLLGSAINQDGRSAGLTAPNGPAQEAVIRAALSAAAIAPAQVGYVETHGTGTPLGDPIEVHALGAALGEGRSPSRPLVIGSIKTNLGHLEAAAGIAGVLKVLVALNRRRIPAHLNLRTRSPQIDWERLPVKVVVSDLPWEPIDGRWIAGVSSFGFSGTNAHVILEAAPRIPVAAAEPEGVDRPQHVLALSARDPEALGELVAMHSRRLQQAGDSLPDLCFSANTGRAHFAHRLTIRAASRAGLAAELDRMLRNDGTSPRIVHGIAGSRPRVAFLFTGSGAQYAGMATGLYRHSPVFRDALDQAGELFEQVTGRPLMAVLSTAGDLDAAINQTRYGQPALVAVEVALATLWRAWGIEPVAVLGHSLGEYAAAHVAGVLSLRDALQMVVARAQLIDSLPQAGSMLTVFASLDAIAPALVSLADRVSIAAENGPEQVVVSGEARAVEAAAAHFLRLGMRVAPLRVAYASHSPLMDPLLAPFETAISGVRFSPPRLTFVSNLTGATAGGEVLGHPAYWRDHLRRPVRFMQSVRHLVALGIDHFVEIGPHPVLAGMGAACVAPGFGTWLPSLRREEDDWQVILGSVQALHVAGAGVDWNAFDACYRRSRVPLPLYPFRRRGHWAEWATSVPAASSFAARGWEAVLLALAQQAERAPIGVDLTDYEGRWRGLAGLTTACATAALRAANVFCAAGERATLQEVLQRLGAAETYRHLVARWLQRLCDEGHLLRDDDGFTSPQPLAAPALDARWAEAERLLAGNQPLLAYVRHCASLLPDVLRGAVSPLETLFPGGSFELADALYRRSATMQYMNGLAASAVAAFVAARGAGRIRALEIGAGTGGTTAAILPQLPQQRSSYRFTDVSSFFFDRARGEFAAYPFVDFAELDIDRDLDAQGHAAQSCDLVVAANVLHASRNLRSALRRLHRLLAPGGLLLLIESTVHLDWFDITTGLIEGWQHFEDDLRRDNPLLAPEVWIEALREAGFEDAEAWPKAGSSAAALGQHVVVARVAGESVAADPATGIAAAVPDAARAGAIADREQADLFVQKVGQAPPGERMELLRAFVRERVVRVLRLEPTDLPGRHDRLMDLGLDSLMAVQLRNLLSRGLGLAQPLPATLMFDYPTIDALAAHLLARMAPPAPGRAEAAAQEQPRSITPLATAMVAAMTDEQVEALLLERLDNT